MDKDYVVDDLSEYLDKHTNLSPEEIEKTLKPITKIILYGSKKKVANYTLGWLFKRTYQKEYESDTDIAVIFKERNKLLPKTIHCDRGPNSGFSVENGQGYIAAEGGRYVMHYMLLSEKELKEGVNKKIDYCLAINKGKRLYTK